MRPKRLSASLPALAILAALAAGCHSLPPSGEADPAAAIRRVLAADAELGTARNHAPETGTLAEAVRGYVAAIDGIDFSGCPGDFVSAFERHRDAWVSSLELLRRHSGLRGEMHQLFDQIRQLGGEARRSLEDAEKRIWDTWAEVEAAAESHGVAPAGGGA